MKTKAKVTMSRWRNQKGESGMTISIVDAVSGIQAVEVDMAMDDFANCITGLAHVSGVAGWRGLAFIGQKRIREDRSVKAPNIDRNQYSKWLEENCKEDGWVVDSYLGLHGSVTHKGGDTYLNYSVTKYIDPDNANESEK